MNTLQAQTITFNKRISTNCGTNVLTGLEVTDSIYYVTGVARDTAYNCSVGALFMRVDSLGNVMDYKIHQDSINRYETWTPCLQTTVDGNLLIGGAIFDTTGDIQALIIKYDTKGNILWKKKHTNLTIGAGSLLRTDDLVIANDSTYITAGQSYYGFQLMNLDEQATIKWSKYISCDTNYCMNHHIVPLADGFVVGYVNSDANKFPIHRTMLCVLTKYDYQGNEQWTWQNDSSTLLIGAEDLIQSKDKGWVIATGIGKEVFNSDGITTRAIYDGYVFKLDSNRNRVWETPLRSHAYTVESRTIRLIELADSSIMTFGMTADTFNVNGATIGQHDALIAKLSPNGDSLWGRRYHYFEQQWSEHEIFDAEQTPDGGFLICGQAIGQGQGASQQGWLLKLDQHGCLVPGCHQPDTTTSLRSLPPQQAQLKLYPNPATDYLNVWYNNQRLGAALTFRIIDQQGRVVQQYQTRDVSDKTYIFPVWALLAGWYVLEVRQDGALVGSEVFLKA